MPEPVQPSSSVVRFDCPHCGHTHWFRGTGQSYPIKLECPADDCFYSFVIHPENAFPDLQEAERHSRKKLPTVGPRHTFSHGSHWILAHQYREVEPHNGGNLTQFVSEDAVRALLQGFSHVLASSVTVLEPHDNAFHRMDPGDPDRYICDFCALVHGKPEGIGRCHESIRAIVTRRREEKKPYSGACWMGLEKHFVPIRVEGRVVAVFVCGNMQTTHLREKQERQIRRGIKEATALGLDGRVLERTAGIGPADESSRRGLKGLFGLSSVEERERCGASPLVWRGEHDHRERKRDVELRASILEDLAEQAYHAQRRRIDGRFINEIGALFNTPEYLHETTVPQKVTRRGGLWRMLSHILHRLADFLEIEEAHYLMAETQYGSEGPREVFVAKASSTPFAPTGALDAPLFKPVLAAKRNRFWPSEEEGSDVVRRLVEAMEGSWKKAAHSVVFCPMVHREDGESCLVLVNLKDRPGFSSAFRRCVRNVAREVSHDINHALRTIRLEGEQERLRDYIENTFHTLNQSMYDIGMAMEILNLRTSRHGFSEKRVHQALNRMRAAVTELDARKDLLYSYVNYRQAVYQFDMPFSLRELILECTEKFKSVARPREIAIESGVDLGEDFVRWDRFHIDVLVTNLIHNAIKYSHRHKNVIVGVRESLSQESIEITVSNFGHGIPLEETRKIFDRGFRSSVKDSRRPVPGTGLGLLMASEVVRNHDGEIRVSSVRDGRQHSMKEDINWEGFNTTFTVSVPRHVE